MADFAFRRKQTEYYGTSPEPGNPGNDKLRLGQLLRDKADSKKRGVDVNNQLYAPLNHQIRTLRGKLKHGVDE